MLTHPWLQIHQDRSRYVVIVVRLIEEDILSISRIHPYRMLLERTILCDPMISAQMLPELRSDRVAALARLDGDELPRHGGAA